MSELKRCPFCDGKLKKSGSKRRGNQFYMHEYNGCILQIICFRTDDVESIEKWNTRKPMERIVERVEYLPVKTTSKYVESKEVPEYFNEVITGEYINKKDVIEIVKEEGGL